MDNIISEPEVYVLGRPALDSGELERFLCNNDVGHWISDPPSDGENVIEVAGRVCYMSFAKPRPGGNKAYINHILEVGHGCYDSKTEILTKNGWKFFNELWFDDEICTLAQHSGEISYQKPTAINIAKYTGKMLSVEGDNISLLVTPNHRMYVCPTTTKKGRKKEDFQVKLAEEIADSSYACTKIGKWCYQGPNQLTVDEARLLGFTIGDGSPSFNAIRFRLRRPRKIKWLTELCNKLGWQLKNNKDRYTVSVPADKSFIYNQVYDVNKEKQIPTSFLFNNSKAILAGLLDGLMNSDGGTDKNNGTFFNTSRRLINQMQQLCLHAGVAANINREYTKDQRQSLGDKNLIVMSILKRNFKPHINKTTKSHTKNQWVDWSGEIGCCQVPNGIIYVRRNGKPVWCGNSVIEHANWTLLFEGISRSLTHELVRHRAGMAYSQLSQRYVDESECQFVIPDCIKNDPSLCLEWQELIEHVQKSYKKLTDGLAEKFAAVEDKTLRRKMARQAARSVLPNATETKIVVTANARAIRHFLEMRGSRHAEDEIRKLAFKLLAVMKEEAPNLFNDYEIKEYEPGMFEIQGQYRKV